MLLKMYSYAILYNSTQDIYSYTILKKDSSIYNFIFIHEQISPFSYSACP